jgi:hypothetical protein
MAKDKNRQLTMFLALCILYSAAVGVIHAPLLGLIALQLATHKGKN